MLCIASLIILIFIKNMIINSKSAKKTILTGGGLIIILLLSYFVLASDEVLISYEKYNITSSSSNMVGMGLWSFYILSVLAVGSIIVAELSKKLIK